jgi:hypothetical protein
MKMGKCPYCGEPLKNKTRLLPFSSRKHRIYEAVAKGGTAGMPTYELIVAMHGPDEDLSVSAYGQLRREVSEMNQVLRPIGQEINGRERGRYRLLPIT